MESPEFKSNNVIKSDISNFSLKGDTRSFDTVDYSANTQSITPLSEKMDVATAYSIYKQNPSFTNKNEVLKALNPTIQFALGSLNASDDPLIIAKAKVHAARAVDKFDPGFGVGLPTYVTSQLRKLTRVVRDARSPIKIPENQVYDAARLAEAEQEFIDKKGREPDLAELSDATGMSMKKIGDIRAKYIKQVSEAQYYRGGSSDTSEDDMAASAAEEGHENVDFIEEALRYVHTGLDHRDKKILEWTTGMFGSKQLTPAEISNRLKISQSQVSRISNKLAKDVNDTLQGLSKTYTGVAAQ